MSIQGFHLMNSIDSRAALTASLDAPSTVRNARLLDWVRGIADLTRPDRIVWCDGTYAEYDRLCDAMVESGTLHRLDAQRRPGSFLARSDGPMSLASRTARSSAARGEGNPTNNWSRRIRCAGRCGVFDGCMRGRTLYVVPFSMGPLGSPIAHMASRSPTVRMSSSACAS
jgi:phosphoenolpyruvate carboxykinase (GTP)